MKEPIKTQTYTIIVDIFEDGSKQMKRKNDGFNPLELLGLCNFVSSEIVQQMNQTLSYEVIERQVINDKP